MTDSILITDGRVVDPGQGMDREMDVLIIDGKIAAVSAQKGHFKEHAERTAKYLTQRAWS